MEFVEGESRGDMTTRDIKTGNSDKIVKESSSCRCCYQLLAIIAVLALLNLTVIFFLWPAHDNPVSGHNPSLQAEAQAVSDSLQQKQSRSAALESTRVQQRVIIQEPKPLNLRPVYIWLGKLPEHHKKKFQGLRYQFRLVRDCDKLLAKMQEELLQKFIDEIYNTVNLKSDICRFTYLYYYGGLYLDADTTVDLPCLNNYLKDKRIFFQATPMNTVDIFTIYSSKPYDPEMLEAIRSYNTFRSFSPPYSTLTTRINDKAKTIAKSGCVTHVQQRAWQPPK